MTRKRFTAKFKTQVVLELGRKIADRTFLADQAIKEIIKLPTPGLYLLSITVGDSPIVTQKVIRNDF